MSSAKNILQIIFSIRNYLEIYRSNATGVDQVLSGLDGVHLTERNSLQRSPQIPSNLGEILNDALNGVPQPLLGSIAGAINAAKHELHWCIDKGLYYEADAEVGEGYANNNMHCEFIGPQSADYYCEDFRFGIFVLGPRVLYRDHCHPAPEFYLNLTDCSHWRFNQGPWQKYEAGSMLWNEANAVHATRVSDQAFLSVYVWTRDVHEKCRVAPAEDWNTIEQGLRSMWQFNHFF